ncbi:MAG: hypothetical protein NW217_08440 [Hyphomicrobiaceae bacterium]|nr:hypothetical protein [Hyphomicrobiaceae bacterium]
MMRQVVADAAFGLAIFTLVAGLVSQQEAKAAPPVASDLVSISANASDLLSETVSSRAVVEAAAVVKAAVPLPNAASGSAFRLTDRTTAMVLLAVVFTIVFAANLTLFRQLTRRLVPVRRRSGRGR